MLNQNKLLRPSLILGVLFYCLFSAPAWASIKSYIDVQDNLAVRARPRGDSGVIHRSRPGDILPLTGRSGLGYLEVLIQKNGRQRRGYILKNALSLSQVMRVSDSVPSENKAYYGILGVMASQSQGSRDLTTGVDTSYQVSAFSGQSTYFGAYVDWPFSSDYAGRLSLMLREIQMEGVATLDGALDDTKLRLTQNFFSLGLGIKGRIWLRNMWWMGELEMAKGTSVSVEVVEGTPIDDSEAESPFFIIGLASLGYDFNFAKKFRLSPSVRLGLVGGSPVTTLTEVTAGLAYSF